MKTYMPFITFIIVGLFFLSPLQSQDTVKKKIYPPIVEPAKKNKPPSDAIVLFDRDSLNQFQSSEGGPVQWVVSGRKFTVEPGTGNIVTRQSFGNCQLHIEWKVPKEDVKEGKTGQKCGNSGIYFMSKYEIQVLNSYENETGPSGQAGAFYNNSPPLVNASLEPGKWQEYDIAFTAPVFNEKEELVKPGSFTVFHNGVLIQKDAKITAPTPSNIEEYSLTEPKLPLMLQDHNSRVSYRNIWIREF